MAVGPVFDTVLAMRHRSRGFTLIEVMLVVFFIGTLLVMAIATYGGGRTASSDRSAQDRIDAALDAASTVFGLEGDLGPVSASRVADELPDMPVFDGSSAATGEAVTFASDQSLGIIGAASLSQDGACWFARIGISATPAETEASYALALEDDAGLHPCTGDHALSLPPPANDGVGASWATPRVLG